MVFFVIDCYIKDDKRTELKLKKKNFKMSRLSGIGFCFRGVGVCFLIIILIILSFAGLASFSLGESLFFFIKKMAWVRSF
jgi:hypothetical protein